MLSHMVKYYVPVNSKLKHPPRPYPGHLTSVPSREGGNLMTLVFLEAGHFDHYSMLRVALIPRGVINHGGDKPWCIQSERYPIRGGLAEKQRLAQALLCIWRYSRTICIIFGVWDCCLLNQVYIHSFRSIIKATEKFPGVGGIWSPGMNLWWGIWTAFQLRELGVWTKIFQKFKCPGLARGEVKALIWLAHKSLDQPHSQGPSPWGERSALAPGGSKMSDPGYEVFGWLEILI